ncbi:hypothetical protein HA150_07020 [Prochlorococcus marinus XMU1414]|uniref:Uncharacterized protein n=1 Tax=Prochlorococcus marinus XMU1424 TaxID=2774497 RepID=A0A9D9G6I1_PROMR|nr:hypothetical protein [Prochlorococcus marinus]MBO8228651.1 hypothetical protein [Prochlorococcus marinus XMU1414]MBW3046130.1 hypothetical protein [Prochlorococcus marinus str. MU1414]MCR8531578.1 hypothetical protein [Prochlorococcus marinus XMU1420]MCR8535307.1 hypothetical protein [Prochlorococcus marinus XMU1424]
MPKRLTTKQIDEIVIGFKSGAEIEALSQKYSCTNSTIIRNLKKYLGELKYKDFIKKSNSLKEKPEINKTRTNNLVKTNFDNVDFKNDSNDHKVLSENITSSNFEPIDSFFEIAPIDYAIDNSSRKELSSIPLSEVDFPKVVYMVVDKKIELEIKQLKDFPEWQFLPQDDLSRKTIEIFFDLNLAKRSCNKEQKVLKVPNTDVFRIASHVLLAKGISRIVCAENLIAL